MTTYEYKCMRSEMVEIRLLTICPGIWSDEIHISLNHEYNLTGSGWGAYEALSYAWGSSEDMQPVLVEQSPVGKNVIQVTQNLAAALRHLRLEDKPRVMWIDAICINQDDNAERSQQVALMGKIYSSASRGVVWLGPEEDDSNHAMEFLGNIGGKVEVDWHTATIIPSELGRDEPRHADLSRPVAFSRRDKHSVYGLFGRSWFKRLWVRQEIALCTAAVLQCGLLSIPWHIFASAVFCIQVKGTSWELEALEDNSTYAERQILVYILCASAIFDTPVAELRFELQNLQWKDSKDSIYAVLNILYDWGGKIEIKPDYDQPTVRIFEDFTMSSLSRQKGLSLLESCEINSRSIPELPTWVPDWSTPLRVMHRVVE
jgi:hypothetical protein